MKKLAVTLLTIFGVVLFSSAQTETTEFQLYQDLFGMEKKAAVADFLELEGASADAFWPMYDEYELERKKLGKASVKLLVEYADNFDSLSDEKIDELFSGAMNNKKATNKLLSTYYKKIKKTINTKTAAQFYQVENYFNNVIAAEISSTIPFVGE